MIRKRGSKKEENTFQYGINTLGVTRVFTKEKTIKGKDGDFTIIDVWTNISKKDENGNYKNISINLYFPRDADRPENNSLIGLENSRLFLAGGEGYERISIFVEEWDYIDG